jgi:hypothetical protein
MASEERPANHVADASGWYEAFGDGPIKVAAF